MVNECVVAVDIGTQSTRAALVDVSGAVLDSASSPIDLFGPRPGWAEQDPEQWWGTTVSNIAAVMDRNPHVVVEAVGVGAQMHSLVAVGRDGTVLGGRSAIWSDKRCAEQVDDFLARADSEELSVLAGNRPLPAWSGFKMAWLRRYVPDAYARADWLLVAKDFINLRLSGEAATNPSESSGSFLCAASTGQWSDDLLEALGVDRSKLPQIVGSASVIGKVSKEVAGETGVPSGTPVVAGSGDMMCQLLASGLTGSGQVSVVSGTSSIIATAEESPATDPRVMNLRLASGNWARFGIGDAAGVSFRWFADRLGGTASAAGPSEVKDVYDRLTAEAAGVPPGSEGLLFFPYLLGERTLGSHMSRASFIGATLGHYRSHFARAVMEGHNPGRPQSSGVPVPRRFLGTGPLHGRRCDQSPVEPDPGGRLRSPRADSVHQRRRHPGRCDPGRCRSRLVLRCHRRGRGYRPSRWHMGAGPSSSSGLRRRLRYFLRCPRRTWPRVATLVLKQASTPVSDCVPETDREGQGPEGILVNL